MHQLSFRSPPPFVCRGSLPALLELADAPTLVFCFPSLPLPLSGHGGVQLELPGTYGHHSARAAVPPEAPGVPSGDEVPAVPRPPRGAELRGGHRDLLGVQPGPLHTHSS